MQRAAARSGHGTVAGKVGPLIGSCEAQTLIACVPAGGKDAELPPPSVRRIQPCWVSKTIHARDSLCQVSSRRGSATKLDSWKPRLQCPLVVTPLGGYESLRGPGSSTSASQLPPLWSYMVSPYVKHLLVEDAAPSLTTSERGECLLGSSLK